MSKFIVPFNWTDAEKDACNRGISCGWDSANYREAYVDQARRDEDETFADEGIRRGLALFLRSDERMAWLSGWFLGRTRFAAGEDIDGTRTPFDFEIGPRTPGREEVDSVGTYIRGWVRVINGVLYTFIRVEDVDRNAYIDVKREGEPWHTFKGKASGEPAGLQNFSQALGKLIRF